MSTKAQPTKYLIGTFEITDKESALSLSGFVTGSTMIKSLFLLNLGKFGDSNICSMAFSSVELRGLAGFLLRLNYNPSEKYIKHSGGNNSRKEMQVFLIDTYTIISMSSGGKDYKISILSQDVEALGEEIKYLVENTVDNCYLTQRSREKIKRKKRNNE